MGYDTNFTGQFDIDRPLESKHYDYLMKFSETRRISRKPSVAIDLPDPIRKAVGLPIGVDGGYFVGGLGFAGQDYDPSVRDSNTPPASQPGLWCQWVPNEDGTAIQWNNAEKFYNYIEWIEYLIQHFLGPWGYKLNGQVYWSGERAIDIGYIKIKDNIVSVYKGCISYSKIGD